MESTASFRRPARRGQRREGVDGKLRQATVRGWISACNLMRSVHKKLNKHKVRRILVGASGQQGLGAG